MLKIFDKCYSSDGPEESNRLSIAATIGLVAFMIVSIMYALYLFIHAIGISDVAGVHISKSLMLAVKNAKGELYSNEEKGIKDWLIYKDEKSGLVIKYPNDLLVGETSEKELEFKKMGPGARNKPLLYALVINEDEVEDVLVSEEFMRNKYPEWNGEGEKSFYGGKEGKRTGVFKSVNGIYKEIVFWRIGNKLIYTESRYYLPNYKEEADMFNKIISEISII